MFINAYLQQTKKASRASRLFFRSGHCTATLMQNGKSHCRLKRYQLFKAGSKLIESCSTLFKASPKASKMASYAESITLSSGMNFLRTKRKRPGRYWDTTHHQTNDQSSTLQTTPKLVTCGLMDEPLHSVHYRKVGYMTTTLKIEISVWYKCCEFFSFS